MPKVSVIVPVYNVDKYIRRCVGSIFAQTFTDYELILVDDGSPDESGGICDEYANTDSRILVFHKENQGQAVARNIALDWIKNNSKSEWISFVDSDDWIHQFYLQALLNIAISTDSAVSVCGLQKVYSDCKIQLPNDIDCVKISNGRDYVDEKLSHDKGGIWVLWDKLWKRDLWNTTRLTAGRICEDNAVVYKIIYDVNQIAEIDQVLYYYYQNPRGTMSAEFSEKKLDWPLVLQEMSHYFHQKGEIHLERICLRRCIDTLFEYYGIAVNQGDYRITRRIRKMLKLASNELRIIDSITISTNPKIYRILHPIYSRFYWKTKEILEKVSVNFS